MADCIVRVAAVKRTFPTTSGPANGATWCIAPVTSLKAWNVQPGHAYADSTNTHGITVTATGSGDVRYLEVTIPQSVFTSDWWVSPFNFSGFDIAYFDGGGYDAGAGSNEWFVHRQVKVSRASGSAQWGGGMCNAEATPTIAYVSAPTVGESFGNWVNYSSWQWRMPDTTTIVASQHADWPFGVPLDGTGCATLYEYQYMSLGVNGSAPPAATIYLASAILLTTNNAATPDINHATGVSYNDEDVTLSGTDSVDNGYTVRVLPAYAAWAYPFLYFGPNDHHAKASSALIYEWEIRDSGGTLVHTDSAATFTITLDDGDYSAKLWVTDSWGHSSRCGTGLFDSASLYPRAPLIGSLLHPGGPLLSAVPSPDTPGALQVYRFDDGAGSREDLAEVTQLTKPSMWLTDKGEVILQGEPNGFGAATRKSLDFGLTFGAV